MALYYKVSAESDPSLIGVNNFGVQAEILRDKFFEPENYDELLECLGNSGFRKNQGSEQEWNFDIERVELKKKAVLTDFLRFSPGLMDANFLVSDKVRNLLLTNIVRGVQFYKTKVYARGEIIPYSMMYVKSIKKREIDFSISEYRIGNKIRGYSSVSFLDEEQFSQTFEKNLNMQPIVIGVIGDKSSMPKVVSHFGILYISSEIKDCFEKSRISGIKLGTPIELKMMSKK